jgi:hypothetical protein
MKYSNYIGIAAAVLLVVCCFFPWAYISSINATLTGISTPGTSFGRPALVNIFLSVGAVVCFLLPSVGAKRTNLFFCALNLAWATRNFLLLSACELGECPERKPALYALAGFAFVMMIMSLFPKTKLDQ